MKKVLSMIVFLVLVLTISTNAKSPSSSKLLVVINEATWCPYCKANGERVNAFLKSNESINVFNFNVTDKDTRAEGLKKLEELGFKGLMDYKTNAAMIYVIDVANKKVIDGISLKSTNEKINKTIEVNLEKVTK